MKPRILLTNDDGIFALGLRTLYEALKNYYSLVIVAPASEQSCRGAGITPYHPIHYHRYHWPDDTPAWAVHGTPSDCVKVALGTILTEPPDMVISGVNHGSNAGRNALFSGTIGAAITATLKNIPALAFSFTDSVHEDHFIPLITDHFLKNPPPAGTLININIPPPPIKGLKYARQGAGLWDHEVSTRPHRSHGHLARFGGTLQNLEEHPESDIALLSQGYITATPLHIHSLTDTDHLAAHRDHFESLDRLSYASHDLNSLKS